MGFPEFSTENCKLMFKKINLENSGRIDIYTLALFLIVASKDAKVKPLDDLWTPTG